MPIKLMLRMTKGIRCAVNAGGAPSKAAQVPFIRSDRAPFAMAAAMLALTETYPGTVQRLVRPYGLKVEKRPHAPDVFRGPVSASHDGDSLVFPGNLVVSPRTNSA